MTILVAYVARPEGVAALEKAIEVAQRRGEALMVVNASPGGTSEDATMIDAHEIERVEKLLAATGLQAQFKQFVRGQSAVEEIENLVGTLPASLLVIGLRRRSALGKLILGSVAQEILMTVSCPVLCVKAG